MPNPSPTTANCNKYFDALEDCLMYGLLTVKPNRRPMKRAMAGLTKGKRQAAMPIKKSALFILLFIKCVF